MKHFSKLCILLAVLSALVLAGCSKPTDTVPQDNKEQVCEHEWNEGVVTAEPKCTVVGEKTFTCKICGETKTETIEALGHDWVFDEDTADCTKDGKKIYHCSHDGCNETKKEDSPAHHDFQGGYCEKCGKYEYEEGSRFVIIVVIGKSEEDLDKKDKEFVCWSFPKEKEFDYISLEALLHLKSKYKDCKVKCWKDSTLTFEDTLNITERRIKAWSKTALYVIIE